MCFPVMRLVYCVLPLASLLPCFFCHVSSAATCLPCSCLLYVSAALLSAAPCLLHSCLLHLVCCNLSAAPCLLQPVCCALSAAFLLTASMPCYFNPVCFSFMVRRICSIVALVCPLRFTFPLSERLTEVERDCESAVSDKVSLQTQLLSKNEELDGVTMERSKYLDMIEQRNGQLNEVTAICERVTEQVRSGCQISPWLPYDTSCEISFL